MSLNTIFYLEAPVRLASHKNRFLGEIDIGEISKRNLLPSEPALEHQTQCNPQIPFYERKQGPDLFRAVDCNFGFFVFWGRRKYLRVGSALQQPFPNTQVVAKDCSSADRCLFDRTPVSSLSRISSLANLRPANSGTQVALIGVGESEEDPIHSAHQCVSSYRLQRTAQ